MNGLKTSADLNVIPLGSYDALIGMHWSNTHWPILDCYNKTYTCLYEEGNQETVKGIHILIYLRQVTRIDSRKCFTKGCHIYVTHLEESKENEPQLPDYLVLQEFVDVFHEIPRMPPRKDIYLTIDPVFTKIPFSKFHYRTITPNERVTNAFRGVIKESLYQA